MWCRSKARLTGTIDGGGGNDTVDCSAVEYNLGFTIRKDGTVSVNSAPDLLGLEYIIPDAILHVLTDNVGIADAKNIENLTGSSGDSIITIEDGATLSGTINGGPAGMNILDYSEYAGDVTVNFTAGTATGAGGIANIRRSWRESNGHYGRHR